MTRVLKKNEKSRFFEKPLTCWIQVI